MFLELAKPPTTQSRITAMRKRQVNAAVERVSKILPNVVRNNGLDIAEPAAPGFSPKTPPSREDTAVPDRDELHARTSDALRNLGSCSSFTSDSSVEKHCGRQWDVSTGTIDSVPVEKRADYDDSKNRINNLLETTAKLRENLPPVTGGVGKGNNFHYGCTFVGGKRRCSTY